MADIPESVRRRMIADDLRAHIDATIEQRVSRYMEVAQQGIIANHHFSEASSECIRLYTDGYFFSTITVTQAVAEGIVKFVLERNNLRVKGDPPKIAKHLAELRIVSQECAEAVARIWKNRHDFHHMNPEITKIEVPVAERAKSNITDLATIEREIFAFDFSTNTARNPKYWDSRADGKIGAFLRLSP